MSLEVKVCSGIDVPNAAEPEAIDRCPAAIEQCAETPIILSTSVVPDCSCDDDHQTIEIDEEGDEDEDRAAREGETEQCSQEEPEIDACIKGLIHYKKWWYFREVDIAVDGEMLTGIPAFLHENTLRVINDAYSYFIPMRNIRYIRTPDGLRSSRSEFEDSRS